MRGAHGSLERTIADGLEQTSAYVDRCAAAEGHLVIVDRPEGRRWDEKVFYRPMTSSAGVAIDVWGMWPGGPGCACLHVARLPPRVVRCDAGRRGRKRRKRTGQHAILPY